MAGTTTTTTTTTTKKSQVSNLASGVFAPFSGSKEARGEKGHSSLFIPLAHR